PPVMLARLTEPKLTIEPALTSPPDVQPPAVHALEYGDPFARPGPPSGGSGGDGGAGGTGCCGIGPGAGPNVGGIGTGGRSLGPSSAPKLLFMVEPEYSEEARKSRYQGTVTLRLVVDSAGHPRDVQVVRGIGLGLDERAVEAVGRWRFLPAHRDGKPVPAPAIVEVTFHLL
ncbi:MAG: energy transducer TonB, partial [Bryobacteraceae bacterium]